MPPRDWIDPNSSVHTPAAPFRTPAAPTSILLVDDDPEYVALVDRVIGEDEDLEIHTETTPTDALSRIHEVACVVSAHAMEPTTGLELLAEIRTREPALPFVLHTNTPLGAVHDVLLAHEHTDYLQKGGDETIELLRSRLRRLVEHRRATVRLRRALAGLDAARNGIAVVDPDGTVAFANQQYATQVGVANGSLLGSHWSQPFSTAEAERLDEEAFQAAADGWRWTGVSSLRREDEETSTQITVVGLEDGGFAIVLGSGFDETSTG